MVSSLFGEATRPEPATPSHLLVHREVFIAPVIHLVAKLRVMAMTRVMAMMDRRGLEALFLSGATLFLSLF